MGITHFGSISAFDKGYYVGKKDEEIKVIDSNGNLIKGLNIASGNIGISTVNAVVTLPAMSIVTDVLVKINSAYDGSATIDIGDASNAGGFLPNTSITAATLGVYGENVATRGAYLYDGNNKISLRKFYASATNTTGTGIDIKATVGGSPNTGSATVYVVYIKLA